MKIIKAERMGMCFGVRDAITLARRTASEGAVTVLGDLVHNRDVVASLRDEGIRVERDVDRVETPSVMITAHGASRKRIEMARQRSANVVEATCPLVRYAHTSVEKLVEKGYFPVIIGIEDHVEVRGMTEDLAECAVALEEGDLGRLPNRSRIGVVAQTTQPIAKVRRLVEAIRERFPESEVKFTDTVCRPTKERQSAAEALGRAADVVVVVGGATSNNTRQLVTTCESGGARAYHVQQPDDINPNWFGENDVVGITAGTSTPDDQIQAVERRLERIAESRRVVAMA